MILSTGERTDHDHQGNRSQAGHDVGGRALAGAAESDSDPELVEEHPNARIEDLFDDFQRAIDGRDDYRVAIDWYFMAEHGALRARQALQRQRARRERRKRRHAPRRSRRR